jgi:hypothetical protein
MRRAPLVCGFHVHRGGWVGLTAEVGGLARLSHSLMAVVTGMSAAPPA